MINLNLLILNLPFLYVAKKKIIEMQKKVFL